MSEALGELTYSMTEQKGTDENLIQIEFTPRKKLLLNGLTIELVQQEKAVSGSGTNEQHIEKRKFYKEKR